MYFKTEHKYLMNLTRKLKNYLVHLNLKIF
jgi:hypothetical protein